MNQIPAADTLRQESCRPDAPALSAEARADLLASLAGWAEVDAGLERTYRFENFEQTMAFVTAVAAMAQDQDHHPRLVVEYASCQVRWSTHSAGGITRNDFICAARSDALRASASP